MEHFRLAWGLLPLPAILFEGKHFVELSAIVVLDGNTMIRLVTFGCAVNLIKTKTKLAIFSWSSLKHVFAESTTY